MLGNKGPGIRFLYVDSEKLISGPAGTKSKEKFGVLIFFA